MTLNYDGAKILTLYVREFGSAALFAMLLISMLFLIRYLTIAWNEQGPTKVWRRFYSYENKAAIALMTTFAGAALKNGCALLVLHWQNAGTHPQSFAIAIFYTAGTLVALWGLICLMRALSRYDWPRGTWMLLVAIALGFGAVFVIS